MSTKTTRPAARTALLDELTKLLAADTLDRIRDRDDRGLTLAETRPAR